MHKRIIDIKELIENNNFSKPFDDRLISFLKTKNITATEAEIVLSFIYHLEDDEIIKLLYSSKDYEREPIEDIAFQTFKYIYGGDEDEEKDSIYIKLPPR